MTTAVVIAALAVGCAVLASILHCCGGEHGRRHVPFWSVTALSGLMLGMLIGGAYGGVFSKKHTEKIFVRPPVTRSVRLRHTLLPGDKVKLFQAQGWLNGSPPAIGSVSDDLYVLDIWTDWCPVCADAAPGMVQSHEKFKDRGVQFVSISVLPAEKVRSFVEQNHITWPTGYGATVEATLDYGAFDPGSSQAMNPMVRDLDDAYVVPTIYVLRGDGTVLWTDQHSRSLHKPLDVMAHDLETALEAALAKRSESQPEMPALVSPRSPESP